MKVKKYKAKALRTNKFIEGFYYQQPSFTESCFDTEKSTLQHYLVVPIPGDWGLPYSPQAIEIDIKTLEPIQEISI